MFIKNRDDSSHFISLSDIMTALMMVFLFVSVAIIMQIQKHNEIVTNIQANYKNQKEMLYADLQAEFGINVIRDFIAPKKLLVEGLSDKKLLQKALKKLNPDNDILITNGRGDSIKPEAAIMNYHDISPKVVVDDDEAGQGYKNEIIALGGAFSAANVFTLRDLNGDVCHGGTIEDCLPKEYIQGKANEVLHNAQLPDIELAENTTFCLQLLIHLQQGVPQLSPKATKTDKENREKYIDSIIRQIKTKIAEDFNDRIHAPKLEILAQRIIELF